MLGFFRSQPQDSKLTKTYPKKTVSRPACLHPPSGACIAPRGARSFALAGQELARPEEDGAQLGGDCVHMRSLHTLARRRPWSHDDCARGGARPTSDLVVVLLGWCVLGVLYHPSVPGQCTPFSASDFRADECD